MLVKERYRNSVKNARSYPGADIDSDHNLVMINLAVRLKKVAKAKYRKKWNLENLEKKAESFRKEISQLMTEKTQSQKELSINENWNILGKPLWKLQQPQLGIKTQRE